MLITGLSWGRLKRELIKQPEFVGNGDKYSQYLCIVLSILHSAGRTTLFLNPNPHSRTCHPNQCEHSGTALFPPLASSWSNQPKLPGQSLRERIINSDNLANSKRNHRSNERRKEGVHFRKCKSKPFSLTQNTFPSPLLHLQNNDCLRITLH